MQGFIYTDNCVEVIISIANLSGRECLANLWFTNAQNTQIDFPNSHSS